MSIAEETLAALYPQGYSDVPRPKQVSLKIYSEGGIPPAPQIDSPWPKLQGAALHGLAGEVVRLIEPHTEADPIALLLSFLSEIGAMLNRGPHLILDGSYHPLLFWPVLVGQSSKSRKGTAGRRIERLLSLADDSWTRGEYKGTLSSGEGLAFAVRDAQFKEEPLKQGGKPTGEMQTICTDSGVEDKRLFLVQSEFGAVLKIMAREGNSLSGVLRDAWDGLTLAPMTKANRVRATDPHIGIVAHVTQDELLRNLADTETVNGFGNRFVWFAVRRSKELPFSSVPAESELAALTREVGYVLPIARTCGELTLSPAARELWAESYHDLSSDHPGMAGALLGRAEAQVMRLSGLYAVLDAESVIDLVHLKAALALWQYAEASTRMIFGDSLGDPTADTILRAIRSNGERTDSELSDLFRRHKSAAELERAKGILEQAGLAYCVTIETDGRPRIVWRAGAKKAN
ncbi:MAG: YfjI family protein [Nitrospira sp.]|nr:YfjI family protein [Nitrospira sp.]MDH4243533.1 YfjI family protein [Nitrospira sp.]MDH4355584.1 YfjI family protein [Nitrospira sp.]MDH5318076.1 YfjI family protein [Nitrospira sp.]